MDFLRRGSVETHSLFGLFGYAPLLDTCWTLELEEGLSY